MPGPGIPRKFRVLASFGRPFGMNASVWRTDNALDATRRPLINERTFSMSLRNPRKANTRRIHGLVGSEWKTDADDTVASLRNLAFSRQPLWCRIARNTCHPRRLSLSFQREILWNRHPDRFRLRLDERIKRRVELLLIELISSCTQFCFKRFLKISFRDRSILIKIYNIELNRGCNRSRTFKKFVHRWSKDTHAFSARFTTNSM